MSTFKDDAPRERPMRCKCGGEPDILGGSGVRWVNCIACGESGPGGSTKADAVRLWNDAATEPPAQGVSE